MMRRLLAGLALSAAVPAFAQAAAASDAVPPPSKAEQLLFMAPQMADMKAPRTLAYDYASASAAGTTRDHAKLATQPAADGHCCAAHVEFLSGPQAVTLPDLDDPQGNPILMYFLESEVRQLERATKGQSAHFRRRIRTALADDARVTDTTLRWNGKDVPAHVIRIAPYATDPYRKRFETEAATEYEFTLSDAVPGGVLRLAATVPAAKAGDPPVSTRSLTLADTQPQK